MTVSPYRDTQKSARCERRGAQGQQESGGPAAERAGSTAASGPTAGGHKDQRKVGALPGVRPDKGPSSFLGSGQANHTNPVAWSATQSVSRTTKKAPEHI